MQQIAGILPKRLKDLAAYRLLRRLYYVSDSLPYKQLRQKFARQDRRVIRHYLQSTPAPKLHLGCGANLLPGWLNSDYFPDEASACHIDVCRPFPLADDSVELVFSEHMIEHLPLDGAMNMLRECFRVLRPGGRVRISTPPLEALIALWQQPDAAPHRQYIQWHFSTWLPDSPLRTPATVVNDFVRNWGHLNIFDEPTLVDALTAAGFEQVEKFAMDDSGDERLMGLENVDRMPPGLLQLVTMTIEAVKPLRPATALHGKN